MYSILFDFVFILKCHIAYITCLLGRLNQIISPSVTRKPWRVVSPDAEGRRHRVTLRARAFVSPRGWYSGMSPSKPCDICIMSPSKPCEILGYVDLSENYVNLTVVKYIWQLGAWQLALVIAFLFFRQVNIVIWEIDMKNWHVSIKTWHLTSRHKYLTWDGRNKPQYYCWILYSRKWSRFLRITGNHWFRKEEKHRKTKSVWKF